MCKYKVGDKVVVKKNIACEDRYGMYGEANQECVVTASMAKRAGQVVTISHVRDCGDYHRYYIEEDYWNWVDGMFEGLAKDPEKIVITHDGKKTTATLYRENGSKEQATAKCAPEDTFDFNVGAKLAMERLMEKVKPVEIAGFKIGDRVNYQGNNGTVICFAKSGIDNIGVEFDKPGIGYHDCSSVTLLAGTAGSKRNCRWFVSNQLNHGEAPQYYNGKVICIDIEDSLDNSFTVGKIYEIVDGKFKDDSGTTRPCCSDRVKTLEDFKTGYFANWPYKFIPLVQ